jgi:hypothetical protein
MRVRRVRWVAVRRSSEGEAGEAGEGRCVVVVYAVTRAAAVVGIGVVEGLEEVPEGILLGRHDDSDMVCYFMGAVRKGVSE